MNSEKSSTKTVGSIEATRDGAQEESGQTSAGLDRDAAAIRAEIQKTRAGMSGTVSAIEEKLSPSRLKEQVLEQFEEAREKVKHEVREDFVQVKERVRHEIAEAKHAVHDATVGKVEDMFHSASDTLSDAGSSVVDTLRANPVPAILAGVGLAWLFMSARTKRVERNRIPRMSRGGGESMYGPRGRSYAGRYDVSNGPADEEGMFEHGRQAIGHAVHRAGDAASEVVHTVRDAAGRVVDQAGSVVSGTSERIGAVVHDVGDKATQLAHTAQQRGTALARDASQQARQIENRFEDALRENPLAFGAALVAVGATVGLVLPHTKREDELMGDTRDRLLGSAEQFAHEAVDQLREKAQGVIEEAGGSSSPSKGGAKQQPRA